MREWASGRFEIPFRDFAPVDDKDELAGLTGIKEIGRAHV